MILHHENLVAFLEVKNLKSVVISLKLPPLEFSHFHSDLPFPAVHQGNQKYLFFIWLELIPVCKI